MAGRQQNAIMNTISDNIDPQDQEEQDIENAFDRSDAPQQSDEGNEAQEQGASSSTEQDSSSSSTRRCCLWKCLGYNKVTLCWISLLFFVVMILTTSLLTRNNYSTTADSNKDWILVGAISFDSATFRIRTSTGESQAQTLVVSNPNTNNKSPMVRNVTYDNYVAKIVVEGLESNTRYTYQTLSSDNQVIQSGSFTTASLENIRQNFTIATAGCAWTASTANIFTEIANTNPLLFLHLGDFQYEDINSPNVETRIEVIDRVLGSASQYELFSSTSFVCMWDDHDYLGNDSEGYEEGREAALESYTVGFPHYEPLPASILDNTTGTPVSPYHAFTIGTVRFIISDLRSEATAVSIYSDTQREWLFEELRNSTAYDYVIWVTTKPWIGPAKAGDDSWMGRPEDRAQLSQHIVDVVTKMNFLAISADAHMVAFDDGRNTYYGDNTSASVESFPILQSGPLDRLGSNKGGPFSDGCFTVKYERNHQFSTVEFEFGNDENCLVITSYRVSGSSKDIILTKRLCGETFGSTENAGSGTCTSPTLSSGSIALVSIAGVFLLLCIICSYCVFGKCESTKMSVIMILAFFVSLIAGFGIPLAIGVAQYDTFAILLVSLLQMLFTFIFIVVWSLKKRAGKV